MLNVNVPHRVESRSAKSRAFGRRSDGKRHVCGYLIDGLVTINCTYTGLDTMYRRFRMLEMVTCQKQQEDFLEML